MYSKAIEAYKANLKLTDEQREILIGILLGDAHLETSNKGRTYRLKIEQSRKHETYVMHLWRIFEKFVNQKPWYKEKVLKGKTYVNVGFATLSVGALRFYAHQFYDERGRKKVPRLISRYITPKGLAYWYMDDGSIKSKEPKGCILNTQAFQKYEVFRLIDVLKKKLNLNASIRKQKEGYQIYISGYSLNCLAELIIPYTLDSMKYKIPHGVD